MDAKEFEKNKLDLIYQKNLQKLNAILAFGTVGSITVLAAYITNPLASWQTILVVSFIVLIAALTYKNTNKELSEILNKIDKLR